MHIMTCTIFESWLSGGPAGVSGCGKMSCKGLDYEMWPGNCNQWNIVEQHVW